MTSVRRLLNMEIVKLGTDKYQSVKAFDSFFGGAAYRVVSDTSKAPIGNNIYGLEQALEVIKEKGDKYRLGWVVDSEHIVIDVDCDVEGKDPNRDMAQRVFKLLRDEGVAMIMYSTRRGAHFIFKRNGYEVKNVNKVMTALGVPVDVKVKGGFVIIPFNDNDRKWWVGSKKPDAIPEYLKIITTKKDADCLWGLDDGDGRNDALFRHLGRIKKSQMVRLDSEAIKNSILLANKYIFSTPLDDRELYSTVLRPENLIVSDDPDSDASVFSEYAMRIAAENSIIYTNGTFFMIKDDNLNVYEQMSDEEMDRFVYMRYTKKLKERDRKEVISALKHEVYTDWEDCNRDPFDVPFLNGIVNVKTGGTRPILPSDYITYVIPHKFNPRAKMTENVASFYRISLEDDPAKRKFFSQMLGYCMTRSAKFQVFFIFKGAGGTGKSTLLDVVRNVIGPKNIANLQLTDFNKEFGIEALFNKLVNLGDDISGSKLVDSDIFKKATSGDWINVDRKHKSALVFKPFAKIIFTTNPNPKIADKTGAMQRRMRMVRSDRVIQEHERIPNFIENFTEEDYEIIIAHALTEIYYLLHNDVRQFPDPEESKEMKERLKLIGDKVYGWIRTAYPDGPPEEVLDGKGAMSEYRLFIGYCEERGYGIQSFDTFVTNITDNLNYTVDMDDYGIEIFHKKEALS